MSSPRAGSVRTPATERRWSGAFRICPSCARRNFAGRSTCVACGARLRRPASAPVSDGFSGARRASDRLQFRRVAVAGAAVAIVALVSGILVQRSLRGAEWAGAAGSTSSDRRQPSPAWQAAPPPLPALPRPEDRTTYDRGRRLLAAGEAKAALAPLTEAARRLPGDPAVLRDYGLALIAAGQQDLGLFQLEHASRLAPGIGSYRLDFIRALLTAGRRGPAARELGELLARDPTDAVAAGLLASLNEAGPTAAGGASPEAAPAMDLGGAGTPASRGGTGPFTNEDLARQRPAVPPSPPA